MSFKIDQKVKLYNKNCQGVIKFIGKTSFGTGTWIGVLLNKPFGKNNGSVQGKSYFTCAENHGIFVRPNQIVLIENTENINTRGNESLKSSCQSLNKFQSPLISEILSSKLNESEDCLKLQETNTKLTINVTNLQKQLGELQEEHEKLRKIHVSNQEKLKDYELLKSNHNELPEFKRNCMEDYQILQKAQHDLNLENLRENHKKEMEFLTNELELVIIDKEIAEKQNDLIQDYLDESRKEVKQLHIELSVLREKINNNNDKAVFITNNDYQRKNLEDENKCLRETLEKIREVLIDEKRNHQKSVKNLEIKKSKIDELNIINENLNKRINEQDDQIKDLKEQIDATLRSEEMIILLVDQKLSLEEHVVQLKNDLTDLQNLKEVLNEINEENHEVNKNLHTEIQTYEFNIIELKKTNDSLNEIIKDRELTIVKYRDLVQKLQSKLNNADEILNEQQQQNIRNDYLMIDNIEFQKIFNKSKEFEQNIDVELREIHVEKLLQHI